MSKVFWKLVSSVLAPLVLVVPAAAADLLPYENGYLPEPYARPHAYTGYPGPAYGRPDYRDIARYCEPDDWAVADGYIPPAWCFSEGPERALAPIGVPAPYPYQRGYTSHYRGNYPIPGYASGPPLAPAGGYGNYPYRAGYEPDPDYLYGDAQ
jgi:hypothetical protein